MSSNGTILSREDIVNSMNHSGLASQMTALAQQLAGLVAQQLGSKEELTIQQKDKLVLNSVGPAAATSAIHYALSRCRKQGKFLNMPLTNNQLHNFNLLTRNDDPVGDYPSFSNVLRQFLLPRYAYLDFDTIVDPRHNINHECGYPQFITPIMYRYMYDRDDVSRRVVDIYPDESWAVDPVIYETEDEDDHTAFEKDWDKLCRSHNLLQYLYRMDRLCGIGHYGSLLLGVDDGEDLEKPIDEPELLMGAKDSIARKRRNLLYLRPFDEYLSFIHQYETNVLSPRYGLPVYYNLVFLDMTIDAAGASIGTRLNRRVHWSRVVHVADNLQSSLVFGVPRQQPVFNRLLDLRKIKGGSAEMFWKGAFPGISFEVDPRFVADDPDFDKEAFKKEVENYAGGLQRYLTLIGIKANSLAPNISENPDKHVHMQMQAIATHFGIPLRVFFGSEEGRLASSHDKLTWNQRLKRRLRTFVEPSLIRNFVSRLVAIGCVAPPREEGVFLVDWADLNTPTDEDKANLALKWTQALSQYVATGMIHLMTPQDYLTVIMGLTPALAMRIIATAKEEGQWQKLLEVDPAQGAGVNGVRENQVSKGDREGTAAERPTKRNTADKKSEGISS